MTTRPIYVHFFVMKSYEEILYENDYNTEIRKFIHNAFSKIGKQWVVEELETIFTAAYWLCGSLSHDFRKYDHYRTVINSLANHKSHIIRGITEFPEDMDALNAIVYLILTHDVNYKRQNDIDNAIGSVKDKRIATDITQFSMENKRKYHYDYSISIDRNWNDEEIEEWMDGYWSPDTAAKKIFSFVSYFDEEDREGMMNRANSAVRTLHSKWNTYLDSYEIDEYNKELSKHLKAGIEAGELERKGNKKVEKQVSNEEIDTIREGKDMAILNNCTIHTYIENQYVSEQTIENANIGTSEKMEQIEERNLQIASLAKYIPLPERVEDIAKQLATVHTALDFKMVLKQIKDMYTPKDVSVIVTKQFRDAIMPFITDWKPTDDAVYRQCREVLNK